MAIEFARSERISRGKGGNAVRSAAYAMREHLYDERTGITYRFKHDGTLEHAQIYLPDGAETKYLDASTLFNEIERAEVRKDAQVARVVVMALDNSISRDERIEQAEGFAKQLFVDRGYPVLVAVHSPHDGGNHHAHLIGGTRQLGPEGFATHKVRLPFTRAFGRPIEAMTERVGELWRDFQNKWFGDHGRGVTVDPVAPVPGEHIGPRRFRHPRDPRIKQAETIRQVNAQIIRDPAKAAAHLHAQGQQRQQPFDQKALATFLAKYIPEPERANIQADIQTRLHNLQRQALQRAAEADRVLTGGILRLDRPRTIEDVARELSPTYRDLINRADTLRKKAAKWDSIRNKNELGIAEAKGRIDQRWQGMNAARRLLHTISSADLKFTSAKWRNGKRWRKIKNGILADPQLQQLTIYQRRREFGKIRAEVKRTAAVHELSVVTRRAAEALEKVRAAAEQELRKHQQIAQNAREGLKALIKEDSILRQKRGRILSPRL